MVYNNKSLELKDIYMAFALNIYLRAERFAVEPGTKHNVINAVFPHLSSKFEGCLVARTKLSKNLHKHIGFGEFVTMDEKQRKWRGASKCIKKVLAKKNDPIGHWITQACVSLQESSRSFIFGLYLFMGTSSEGKSVETKEKVWTWLIDLMQPTTRYLIVCCDCFYLDNSAQALLNEQGVPFHCSVKAAWYKFASAHLGAKLDQMDTWAGMANKNTGEVAVMTWNSEKNVGKKLLLSTSLKKVPGKQRTTNPPGWILYKTIFKHCQNRIMFKQFFQAEALGICQLDSCHLGSLNEIIAVLLMATKFGVTVLVFIFCSLLMTFSLFFLPYRLF
ncbi:L-fuconate dehydratase [Balamuthia mandrillaris]